MPLSLQHHFDRRIVSRPEVARRLVLAVPTHLQDPVCRNGLQVVGITGVVVIQPNPNRRSLQRRARTPRKPGAPLQGASVRVWLNDHNAGYADYLKTIPADRVLQMRWYSQNEAASHFGPTDDAAIEVVLKR